MMHSATMATRWLHDAGTGFLRSVALAAAALFVPAIALLPAFVDRLLGDPWSWSNPWSWFGLLLIACPVALVFALPVGRLFRRLTFRWTGVQIDDGYRQPPAPVQMATGYWWNGSAYERTRRDAELDQRWRRLGDPAYLRDVRWLAVAAVTVGPVSAMPSAAVLGAAIAFAHPSAVTVVVGVLLVVVAAAGAPYAYRIVGPVATRWLRPPDSSAMSERVRDLEAQRADATAAQAAEIRRIERDLHDGAQARLVAVGLSLATAEKLMDDDPERAKALLREARDGTSASLAELRELVRGVNPPVLVERGLVDAVRALALDSPLEVTVLAELDRRADVPVEAALYFGVAELLANAAKYAGSAHVQVRIQRRSAVLTVEVTDDGPGGATVVPGGGLDGIRRRLAAFDGTLTVLSPAGGMTRARMEIPCA